MKQKSDFIFSLVLLPSHISLLLLIWFHLFSLVLLVSLAMLPHWFHMFNPMVSLISMISLVSLSRALEWAAPHLTGFRGLLHGFNATSLVSCWILPALKREVGRLGQGGITWSHIPNDSWIPEFHHIHLHLPRHHHRHQLTRKKWISSYAPSSSSK